MRPEHYNRLGAGRLMGAGAKPHELEAHLVQRSIDPNAFRLRDPVTGLPTGRPLTTGEISHNINTREGWGYTGLSGVADPFNLYLP